MKRNDLNDLTNEERKEIREFGDLYFKLRLNARAIQKSDNSNFRWNVTEIDFINYSADLK